MSSSLLPERLVTGFSHRLPPMKRRLPPNMFTVSRQWLLHMPQVVTRTSCLKFSSSFSPMMALLPVDFFMA